MKKISPFILFLYVLAVPVVAYGGWGFECKRGGEKYDDKYFGGKYNVRTEICLDAESRVVIATNAKNPGGYPSCAEFGWKKFDLFSENLFGMPKCNAICRSVIGQLAFYHAEKICELRDYVS